jgi:hypothetical protein
MPVAHLEVCCLKHDLLQRIPPQNGLDHVRPSSIHILRDTLSLKYHAIDTHINKPFSNIGNALRIGGAYAWLRCRRPHGIVCRSTTLGKTIPVIGWQLQGHYTDLNKLKADMSGLW